MKYSGCVYALLNFSLGCLQRGHFQSSGRSSNATPSCSAGSVCYFTAKGKTPVNATGAKGETEPSNLNAIAEGKEDGSVGVNHINHKITPSNDLD